MARVLKNFSDIQPLQAKSAAPQTNSFTLDLAGLNLSEEQLSGVRQEAVKAALLAASSLSQVDITDSFSTFSTFSTFSSGSAGRLPGNVLKIPSIVDRVIKGT
jgi:hypothetical protein